LYAVSLTALWLYDYFLTLDDEVVEFPMITTQKGNSPPYTDPLCMEKGEISQWASLRTLWCTPTDHVLVFILFLLVSNLRFGVVSAPTAI